MRWRRMADTARRRPSGREAHAVVGPVVDQTAVGQPLDRRGDRPRRHPEGLGQVAGVGVGLVLGVAIDRLQGFPFRL